MPGYLEDINRRLKEKKEAFERNKVGLDLAAKQITGETGCNVTMFLPEALHEKLVRVQKVHGVKNLRAVALYAAIRGAAVIERELPQTDLG